MLTRERDIEVTGTLGGRVVDMGIDIKSVDHLMSFMSNIYSDTRTAVVRELATNAADSHIRAGNSDPIEIITPTALNPSLVVIDYGIGMSTDEIENTFLKYGASTKRDSNDEAGYYGIGSKSPLAYGSQTYSVVSIKDGVKTSIVIGKDSSAGGAGELFVSETEEPNGVKISVPVNNRDDHAAFNRAAHNFQRYSRFPVKVDGELLKITHRFLPSGRFVIEDRPFGGGPDLIVMGNVAYRLMPDGRPMRLLSSERVVIYADMGDVEITPNREDLLYSSHTRDNVDKYANMFIDEFISMSQDRIDNSTTHRRAYKTAKEIKEQIGDGHESRAKFTYKGEEIPESFGFVGRTAWVSTNSGTVVGVTNQNRLVETPNSVHSNHVCLLNYHNSNFTKLQAQKVEKYLADNNIDATTNVVVKVVQHDPAMLEWFSGTVFLDWKDVRKTKLHVVGKSSLSAWTGAGAGRKHKTTFVPDTTKNIYYIMLTDIGGRYGNLGIIEKWASDEDQVFIVPGNLKKRFFKEIPNAKPHTELTKRLAMEYINGLSDQDRFEIEHKYATMSIPVDDKSLILDEDLHPYVGLRSRGDQERKFAEFERNIFYFLSPEDKEEIRKLAPDTDAGSRRVRRIQRKYPLLTNHSYDGEHVLLYVNAAYEKFYKEEGK